jgi:hypothetical protein
VPVLAQLTVKMMLRPAAGLHPDEIWWQFRHQSIQLQA